MKDDLDGHACPSPDGKTQIVLSIGDQTVVETYSAATTNERLIEDAYVLVFDANGKYVAQERVNITTDLSGNGNKNPIIATGLKPVIGQKVVVLVNTGKADDYLLPLTVGTSTVDNINAVLGSYSIFSAWDPNSEDNDKSSTRMPMSGETVWSASNNNIDMYRSLAKLQLQIDDNLQGIYADHFKQAAIKDLVEWSIGRKMGEAGYLYLANGGMTVPADAYPTDDDPSLCLQWTGRYNPNPAGLGYGAPIGSSDTNPRNKVLYIPEYPYSTNAGSVSLNASVWDTRRTCMIVMVDGNEYYRIDFYDKTTGEYIDFKRNCHYIVHITSVNSRGYANAGEAYANPGGNLEYEIEVVGDEYLTVTSNGQYLVKTDKKAAAVEPDVTEAADLVKFACQITDDFKAGSDMPESIATRTARLVGADKQTGIEISKIQLCYTDGTAIPNNEWNFSADDAAGYQLKYTTAAVNALPTEQVYLEIAYGNIKHYVPITPFVLKLYYPSRDIMYVGGSSILANGITSYKVSDDTPAAWKTEFSTDGGRSWTVTRPAWITDFTMNGAGSKMYDLCRASIAAQTAKPNLHNAALRNAAAVSNYNLSNHAGGSTVENTANCYVVNAPGSYIFPAVYGNGYKNKSINYQAYKPTTTGSNILSPFVDYLGNSITHPEINKTYTPANACLVWQDSPNLISDVALVGTSTVSFKVDRATIRQGNAIIALRDASDRIIWSWHIWVTDYRLGDELKTIDNGRGMITTVMPYYLGWCFHDEYDGRSVQVRITQTESGLSRTFTVNQLPYKFGDCTFYQWGRKDPMLGLLPNVQAVNFGTVPLNKSCYAENQAYMFSSRNMSADYVLNNKTRLQDLIREPYCMDSHWVDSKGEVMHSYLDHQYSNLWSANSPFIGRNFDPPYPLGVQTIKTIYDPSPVGYCIAPTGAFNSFSLTGKNIFSDAEPYINTAATSYLDYTFYCEPNKTGETITLYKSGFRNGAVKFQAREIGLGVGSYFYLLLANPLADYTNALTSGGSTASISVTLGSERGLGLPVLPAKEQ